MIILFHGLEIIIANNYRVDDNVPMLSFPSAPKQLKLEGKLNLDLSLNFCIQNRANN